MLDLLQSSFALRASLAAMLALFTVALIGGSVYWMLRLGTPRGDRIGRRPDPIQGPQESVDLVWEREAS